MLHHSKTNAFARATISDANLYFVRSVSRVKMRRLMIIMVHRDNNPEKPADLRHSWLILLLAWT